VPEMRQREGRAADLGGGSENFEKELMDGSGSVSSRSLTLFEMTDPLHCCHSERQRGIFLLSEIRANSNCPLPDSGTTGWRISSIVILNAAKQGQAAPRSCAFAQMTNRESSTCGRSPRADDAIPRRLALSSHARVLCGRGAVSSRCSRRQIRYIAVAQYPCVVLTKTLSSFEMTIPGYCHFESSGPGSG
jgi:hypothetical protein